MTTKTKRCEALLFELLKASKVDEAPFQKNMFGGWHSAIVAIGAGHTAEILLDDKAYSELLRRADSKKSYKVTPTRIKKE